MLEALVDALDAYDRTTIDLRALCKGIHPRPGGGGWSPVPNSRTGGFRKKKGNGWEYWYPSAHHAMAEHHHAEQLRETGRWEHRKEGEISAGAQQYLKDRHGLSDKDIKDGRQHTRVVVDVGKKGKQGEITAISAFGVHYNESKAPMKAGKFAGKLAAAVRGYDWVEHGESSKELAKLLDGFGDFHASLAKGGLLGVLAKALIPQ